MKSDLQISVITLALHMEKTLLQAAVSVLNEPDTEIIIVHPSPTGQILTTTKYLKQTFGERVKLVFEPDLSPAEGLNNGLRYVTGDVIGVLNGDDFYFPGSLKLVNEIFFSDPSVDILTGSGILMDEDRNVVKFVFPYCKSRFINRLAPHKALTFFHQGLFYRKSKYTDLYYNEQNKINWDYEFFVDMLLNYPKIKFTSQAIGAFRINKFTLSGSGKYIAQRQENSERIANKLGKPLEGLPYLLVAKIFRYYKFMRSVMFAASGQFQRVNLK